MFYTRPINIRYILFVFCVIFAIFVWIDIANSTSNKPSIIFEAINILRRYFKSNKIRYLPKDFKFILFWTPWNQDPLYYLGEGPGRFLKYDCEVFNCYVTSDRELLPDLRRFDAIIFKAKSFFNFIFIPPELPKIRSPHQKYILFEIESADNYPICYQHFNSFFNWTMTYKLNSDIPFPYVMIKSNGSIIGPKKDMNWINDTLSKETRQITKAYTKTKAVAWFVSNCMMKRLLYGIKLQRALIRFNLSVDIYGDCGYLSCPKGSEKCEKMLQEDYYFYLAFENSFAEDYVTEKVLTALRNDAVPIVYGGANYSRFLPPGSYLDALATTPKVLAARIYHIISLPDLYQEFFWWKSQYTYHDPLRENLCSLCAAMHNETRVKEHSVYTDIRSWWNPNYEKKCDVRNKIRYHW